MYFKNSVPLLLKFSKKKTNTMNIMDVNNCVYRIKCSTCDACYIGETGRKLGIRVSEHRNNKHSNPSATINIHANKEKHRIDYENPVVLRVETNHIKRKMFESLYLKRFKLIDNNRESVSLRLF